MKDCNLYNFSIIYDYSRVKRYTTTINNFVNYILHSSKISKLDYDKIIIDKCNNKGIQIINKTIDFNVDISYMVGLIYYHDKTNNKWFYGDILKVLRHLINNIHLLDSGYRSIRIYKTDKKLIICRKGVNKLLKNI